MTAVFRYLVRRMLQMILTFFGATFVLYALMFANQDDPLQTLFGDLPVPENVRTALTERYHLNDSLPVQYWYFVTGLLRGDFGRSLTGRDIGDMLTQALPVTAKLGLFAAVLMMSLAVAAGLTAAVRRGGLFDNGTRLFTVAALAVPTIVLAPTLQLIFGIELRWLPTTAGAHPSLWALLLPAIVLGTHVMATEIRVVRTSVVENLRADYVRTARAKGLSPWRVVGVHVLRNSLIPVVTLLGLDFAALLSGAVITEAVFNIPGIGFQVFRGIRTEDGPVVVGFVSFLVILLLVVNLVVDLLYAVLDPRIRYS